MAQDPERDDEQPDETSVDMSHDLDTVPLYFSQTVDAEVEAEVIRGILESNGIPAVVSSSPVPNLGFQVQVPRGRLEEARRLIEEQQAAGPEAAAEAEAASEEAP
jgi:Putative prokaryotic signal transducing protein